MLLLLGRSLVSKWRTRKDFPLAKLTFFIFILLTFFEFLSATGHERLRSYLEGHMTCTPLEVSLHEKLLEFLRFYFFIGGMPEVVAEYLKTEKLTIVREVQHEILEAYERDFAKHAPDNQLMKIVTVWNQVHRQLAKENKKFIFSTIRTS